MAAPTRDHIRPRSNGVTLVPGNRALASCRYGLEIAGDPRAVILRARVHAPAPVGQKAQSAGNSRSRELIDATTTKGAGSGPRLLNLNRRRKEADREGEQHETAECVDSHV
jgi:hypothetical protein